MDRAGAKSAVDRYEAAVAEFGDPISGKARLVNLSAVVAELSECATEFKSQNQTKYETACKGWILRLKAQATWGEASGSADELELRRSAAETLGNAIDCFNSAGQERLANLCREQRCKWMGVISNHLSEFDKAEEKFREGTELARKVDPKNVIWFEAAVAESTAWSLLKARLVDKDFNTRYADVASKFTAAASGYRKSGDTNLAAICEGWALMAEFLESPSFRRLPSVRLAYSKLGYKSLQNVWRPGSPRRRLKADIVDRANQLGSALSDELLPVRLLEQAVSMAEELGSWLRSNLKAGGSLELNVKVLKMSGMKIPSEIEWLVNFRSGREGTKHGTTSDESWERAYQEARANEERISVVLPSRIKEFKAQVESFLSARR